MGLIIGFLVTVADKFVSQIPREDTRWHLLQVLCSILIQVASDDALHYIHTHPLREARRAYTVMKGDRRRRVSSEPTERIPESHVLEIIHYYEKFTSSTVFGLSDVLPIDQWPISQEKQDTMNRYLFASTDAVTSATSTDISPLFVNISYSRMYAQLNGYRRSSSEDLPGPCSISRDLAWPVAGCALVSYCLLISTYTRFYGDTPQLDLQLLGSCHPDLSHKLSLGSPYSRLHLAGLSFQVSCTLLQVPALSSSEALKSFILGEFL